MSIYAPQFTNEDAAREHLEAIRWPDGPFCPHCGSFNAKRLPPIERKASKGHSASVRKGVVQCKDCREQYSITVGTVFERSKVPLFKWLLATYLLTTSKKGISAHQLHRTLGITYKTAWFMAHRIRESMDGDDDGHLGGPGKWVEADETFVGGKARNRAFRKPVAKKAVMTLVERGGNARSFHVANVTGPTLRGVLVRNVSRESVLMTDDNNAYKALGREYALHMTVNHKAGQYVTAAGAGVNTIEGFWAMLKRGINGTHIHVSGKHLSKYLGEFEYRWNMRQVPHLMLDRLMFSFVR